MKPNEHKPFIVRVTSAPGGPCIGLFPVTCEMDGRTLDEVKDDLINDFSRVWGHLFSADYYLDVRPGLRLAHSRNSP